MVDDHPLVRQGLVHVIQQEEDFIVSDEVGSAQEALDCFKKNKPNLAIMDVSLKGTNGLDLTRSLLSIDPNFLILMVSMYDETLYAERVLRAGARGYLMKQEAPEQVVNALRKILAGEIFLSEKMNDMMLNKLISGKKSNTDSIVKNLSDRELEVLQLVGQGRGTRQIAEELHISVKTIESHYAKIKEKLNLKNSNELIQYAVRWYHVEL